MKRPGRVPLAIAAVLVAAVMVLARGDDGVLVEVEIPIGATLPDVAVILETQEVVGSARLFLVYTRVRRADRKLKAGARLAWDES